MKSLRNAILYQKKRIEGRKVGQNQESQDKNRTEESQDLEFEESSIQNSKNSIVEEIVEDKHIERKRKASDVEGLPQSRATLESVSTQTLIKELNVSSETQQRTRES